MRRDEKRRALEDLMHFGRGHAFLARVLAETLKNAKVDESGLAPIYSKLMATHAYYFIEMAELWAQVPTLVGSMDEWVTMVKDEFGEDWNEAEKIRLDFMASEYQKAVDAAGGITPQGLATHDENGDFTIVFDERDEDDDEA